MTDSTEHSDPNRPTTLLVADDDLDILMMVRHHLGKYNVRVLEAPDGEQALQLTLAQRPDVAILDVMMPGISGWEVCKTIREYKELTPCKVIVLTGIGEKLNEMTSPIYGADAFLDKPFDLDELDATIEKVLGRPLERV